MELREYLNILKKNILLIAGLAIIGAIGAGLSGNWLPNGYRASRLYYLDIPSKDSLAKGQGNGYFESFYAQKKAGDFTDTAVGILESGDFLKIVLPDDSSINVRKVAPQLIGLTVTSPGPEKAKDTVDRIARGFNQKMIDLVGSDYSPQIKPLGEPLPTVLYGIDRKILASFGFIVGSIIALSVIALKSYFKL